MTCSLYIIFYLNYSNNFLPLPLDKQYLLQGQVHPMSPVSDEVEDPTKNSTMSESLPLIKQQTTSVKQSIYIYYYLFQ